MSGEEIALVVNAVELIRDHTGYGRVEFDLSNGEIINIKTQILQQHPLRKKI